MTHVLLVPDKCTPEIGRKYANKKFFSPDFSPKHIYVVRLNLLLNFPNNWYIIKIYSKYLANLLILYIQIAS